MENIQQPMTDAEWIAAQREYLQKQASLRATWLDESQPDEVRERAYLALRQLVAETEEKCPPLTGIFYYTEEEEEAARKAGY
jgi:hypothetical protein